MITDSEPSRDGRSLRVALLLSLIVHGAAAVAYGVTPLSKFRISPSVRPTPEQMVTISDSIRIDRKAVVPKPHHASAAHTPHRRQPPEPRPLPVAAAPVPPLAAPPVPVRPAIAPLQPTLKPAPHRATHELAKLVPRAKAQPPKTIVAIATQPPPTTEPSASPARPETPEPTLPPATARPEKPPAHPHPATAAVPPRRPRRPRVETPKLLAVADTTQPAHPAHATHPRLTAEQIASIDSDLAKSIAHDRSEENPLKVPKSAAAAPRRYRMSVDSMHVGSLKSGEGTYEPVGPGQHGSDGYNYYRCAYAFQWPDGTFEQGVVPWPVRFAPSEDPVLHPELQAEGRIGLPPPPPGWTLKPGVRVGRALRVYFPGVAFAD